MKFIRILQSTWRRTMVGESRQSRWWLGAARSISWYNDLESSIRAGVVDVRRASDELPRSRGTRKGCISAWPTPNLLASTRYRSRERIFRLITLNFAFKGQWYFSLLLSTGFIRLVSRRFRICFELQPILRDVLQRKEWWNSFRLVPNFFESIFRYFIFSLAWFNCILILFIVKKIYKIFTSSSKMSGARYVCTFTTRLY